MVRGIIFDLGETLIRFSGDWPAIFARSRKDVLDYLLGRGYEMPEEAFDRIFMQKIMSAQELREQDYLERPTEEILLESMAEFDLRDVPKEIVLEAVEIFYAESEEHWQPVDDLHRILREVEATGSRMGLISNASDEANVDRLIDKIDARRFFDPILVSATVGARKPAPLIFQKLLHQWDYPADQVVMVGDTLNADILGAKRMGMRQIWLKTAADRPDNVAWRDRLEPDASVEHLREVPPLLHSWLAE